MAGRRRFVQGGVGLAAAALLGGLAGCASLPRYTDAVPQLGADLAAGPGASPSASPSAAPGAGADAAVLLHFAPVFAGRPVAETVVDNAVGAFWSPEEARRIGFTQNYAQTMADMAPQLAMLAAMPAPMRQGFAASGQGGGFNVSSRIMVPIGLYLTRNTEALLRRTAGWSRLCADAACGDAVAQAPRPPVKVVVQLTRLRVAELRPNRLTIEADARIERTDAQGRATTRLVRAGVHDRSIAAEGLFHSDFLRAMGNMANDLSSDFARQVVDAALAP